MLLTPTLRFHETMETKMNRLFFIFIAIAAQTHSLADAQDIFGENKAPETAFPGEYVGTYLGDKKEIKYGLQIFALGNGKFRAVGYNGGLPAAGFKKGGKIERVEGKITSNHKDTGVILFKNGKEEAEAHFKDGMLIGYEEDTVIARLKKIVRDHPVIETD